METEEVGGSWWARQKAGVLEQAIEATGGPDSDLLASVKNYIDRKHPEFAWSADWASEIQGAKAALRHRRQQAAAGGETSARPSRSPQVDENDLRLARQFVDQVGEGCTEKARWILEFLSRIDDLERLSRSVEVWAELLEAVGGNVEAAESVIAVVARRFLAPAFPRIAQPTIDSKAA